MGDRSAAGGVCTDPVWDVTALLEIAPEEAQRLLDAMLQAGALEEKEGWYQIAK